MNPKFVKTYFNFANITYNLRNGPILSLPPTKSTYFGTYTVLSKACLVWNRFIVSSRVGTPPPSFSGYPPLSEAN